MFINLNKKKSYCPLRIENYILDKGSNWLWLYVRGYKIVYRDIQYRKIYANRTRDDELLSIMWLSVTQTLDMSMKVYIEQAKGL